MPSVNFVHRDREARVWVSISTWRHPRDRAFHRDVADGCVILLDGNGARIVADGIGYTNEVKVDPSGQWLYVNETMARRLSRYAIDAPGAGSALRLGPRQTVVDYIDGVIPDGFEFDGEGGVWCASVMSNRVVRVAADGSQHVIVEDCDAAEIATGMAHWRTGTFSREHMNVGGRRRLGNVASVTFGGPDLKTVYLGSLSADNPVHVPLAHRGRTAATLGILTTAKVIVDDNRPLPSTHAKLDFFDSERRCAGPVAIQNSCIQRRSD